MNGFIDWHRLFGITLTDFFTGTAYTVELEKDLSLKKQFLDVVIIRKKEGAMPDELPDGFENMGKHNLISYKSLHEPFDDWSADELIGHFVNYRKQVSPSMKNLLPKEDFRLYAVCTRFPEKLEKQTVLTPVSEGVYDLKWGIRNIRLIVTYRIAMEKKNAVWLMFSDVRGIVKYGASNYRGKLKEMNTAIRRLLGNYGIEGITDMPYTVEDFRKDAIREAFGYMTPAEMAEKFPDELIVKLPPMKRLIGLPPEERLRGLPPEERLKGLPPEERLRGLPPEESLRGLPPEEIFRAFSPEEIRAYLKKLPKKVKPAKKKGTTLKKSA